jgi:cytochrome P450
MPANRAVRSYPFGELEGLELHPLYGYLREHEPLSRVRLPYGEETWLVVRHGDARTVFGDLRFSRAAALDRDEPRLGPLSLPKGIMTMDPPEHTRLRSLVAKAFTARRIGRLRPMTERVAGELLDAMAAAGPPADLVRDFGLPLPVAVICDLLGVPYQDRERFQLWSRALLTLSGMDPEESRAHVASLGAYMTELLDRRRGDPADDLLSALVLAHDEGDRLTGEELVALSIGLLAAGYETTANQIPDSVVVLLADPDQLALLRDRPDLLPTAVEELLRFVPLAPGAAVPRYATEDVELSGGTVRAGDPVVVARTAANRDPRVFAEPDRLDLTRDPNPHLGFGHGVHHCLGAQLARMELQVALGALLARFPGLRLAEAEIEWKKGGLRGPVRLPVTW